MARDRSAPRNSGLDFAKGVLVLLMVVYHWFSIFVGSFPYVYDLLRFLTPSFIFITGAIIGSITVPRYGFSALDPYRRLVFRGLRLVVLFTALNLAIQALFPVRGRPELARLPVFTADLLQIFGTGNSSSHAFRVLLPIGYLLILSPVAVVALRSRPLMLLLAGILAISIQIGEATSHTSANLMLLTFGLFGFLLYYVRPQSLDSLADLLWPPLILYFVYLALLFTFGAEFWVQCIGVPLNVLLIYGLGRRLPENRGDTRLITLVGRYSLLGYVCQIAILQSLMFLVRRLPGSQATAIASLPIAGALMIASIVITERLRARSSLVDRMYNVVFN